MRVFLVRHAVSNISKGKWQTSESKLGKVGESQSKALAKRSRFQSVDLILSSKWTRAKETAEIISKITDKPLELFDGIHERKQHPEIYGLDRKSKISMKYYREAYSNYANLDWKYDKKEESYRELIERTEKFRRHLEKKHEQKTLLVISHEIFIRCFIASCLLGRKYDDLTFKKIYSALTISNTGISLLEYVEKRKTWRLWYLNDFSHLKSVNKRKVKRN